MPIKVQWLVRNEGTNYYTPININCEEFRGTTHAIPKPRLVVKRKNQIKPYSFQIRVENFIGTIKREIPG